MSSPVSKKKKKKISAEYRVIRNHFDFIVKGLEPFMPLVEDLFTSEGLIVNFVVKEASSTFERAEAVVHSILRRIEYDASCYYQLVDVLKRESDLKEIADFLEHALNEQGHHHHLSASVPQAARSSYPSKDRHTRVGVYGFQKDSDHPPLEAASTPPAAQRMRDYSLHSKRPPPPRPSRPYITPQASSVPRSKRVYKQKSLERQLVVDPVDKRELARNDSEPRDKNEVELTSKTKLFLRKITRLEEVQDGDDFVRVLPNIIEDLSKLVSDLKNERQDLAEVVKQCESKEKDRAKETEKEYQEKKERLVEEREQMQEKEKMFLAEFQSRYGESKMSNEQASILKKKFTEVMQKFELKKMKLDFEIEKIDLIKDKALVEQSREVSEINHGLLRIDEDLVHAETKLAKYKKQLAEEELRKLMSAAHITSAN